MPDIIKGLFFFGDLIFLNLSILLSYRLFNDGFWIIDQTNIIYLLIFSNLSWLFLVMVSSPYNITKGWSAAKIVKSQLAFLFIHLLIMASLVFFFKRNYSLLQISVMYGLFIPIFFSWKILTYYFKKVFSNEVLVKNYVLIGRNEVSNELRKYYLMNPQLGFKFKGYFDFNMNNPLIENIRDYCAKKDIHEIYCCAPSVNDFELRQLVNFGLDSLIKVRIIVESMTKNEHAIQLERFEKHPGISLAVIPLDETRNQIFKRVFDLLFSTLFLLIVLSWLVPLLFIIIKLDSRGPVFFVQLRSGKDNRPFKCLKFRTMVVNKDADSIQATKHDLRITKLGHFLRKTSIDELPQFINVFFGTMSVVGPRPHMLKHTEEYSKIIERFLGRHYVKPGITGLAQCLGYRGETINLVDMENRVRMDRHYIENWTFWLDIKIIFLTVVSLTRGSDKAY